MASAAPSPSRSQPKQPPPQPHSTEYLVQSLNEALAKHKNGLLDESIDAYNHVISYSAGFPSGQALSTTVLTSIHGNLAALYLQRGLNDKALENFELAIKYTPDNAQAHYNMAIILTSKKEEHKKALTHCIKAARLNPTDHRVYHLIGNIFQALGRMADAETYYIKAEALALENEGRRKESEAAAASTTDVVIDAASGSISADGTAEKAAAASEIETSLLPGMFRLNVDDTQDVIVDDVNYSLRCLSRRPFVFQVEQLLTEEECDHIIARAQNTTLAPSFVMGGSSLSDSTAAASTSSSTASPYRDSYNAWLPLDDVLQRIQRRVAGITGFPLSYLQQKAEDLQVVKYVQGGVFKVHHDSTAFHRRMMTILLYLSSTSSSDSDNDAENSSGCNRGGSTWFPFAADHEGAGLEVPSTVTDAINSAIGLSENEETGTATPGSRSLPGLTVFPRRGRAIIFINHALPDFKEIDVSAVHAGMPVLSGEKWIANYWIGSDAAFLRHAQEQQQPSSASQK